ncbi:MAG: DUF2993 domain-containing protein [Stenomitos rutilans HA7619-LM2]|jgi:hypothetical protein|nr:DUF2993 domain-containing protein [Stenomitos rutilans HA7619-LM2]
MSKEPRLDEQVISQVAHAGLSSQVEAAEDLNVDVQTDALKAAQGKADSVAVSGHGVVVQKVRVHDVTVQTDRLAVNPLSLLLGQLKLDHPLDATAQVVLTEADLNQAMQAEAVTSRLPTLEMKVEGEPVSIELVHPIAVKLPADGKIALNGAALLYEREAIRQVGFSVVLMPRTDERPVLMESFVCEPGEGLSIEFVIALMQTFNKLLALPYIEIEGIAIRVKRLSIQSGKMLVETEAHIPQMPPL